MKFKYLLMTILTFLFIIPSVNAEKVYCDREDINRVKEIVDNIYMTIQYAKDENGNDTGKYNLTIKGLTEELYIIDLKTKDEYYYNPEENINILNLSEGIYKFEVYYESCDELIKTINYRVPRYNHYANDPLCKDISEEELDVCDRRYQGEVTDEILKQEVEKYNKKIGKDSNVNKNNNKENNILNILKDYYFYIIAIIILIVVITGIIVLNKKRGALE